jgi:serine/threonine-protein kinase
MIGEVLSSYVIERKLGEGGMGEVYLAAHRRIAKRVAIKLLLPEHSRDQTTVDRFFTEARATSLIDHPNIVEVVDCDIHPSGRAYIIMEYLRGESLSQVLRRVGDLRNDLGAFFAIAQQMASALAAAHAKGIVHRDLKPDNIFLTRGAGAGSPPVVKILDFGIAKLAGGGGIGASKTRTGSLLGTPLYMSPEQCRGASNVDYRSDIYSLGCVLFEMVSGRRPFEYEAFGELILAHVSEEAKPPSAYGIMLPAGLDGLLMRMLAKVAAERPSTMGEVEATLRQIAAAAAPGPSRLGILEPPEEAAPAPLPAVPTPAPAQPITAGGTAILDPSSPAAAHMASSLPGIRNPPPSQQTTLSRGAGEITYKRTPTRRGSSRGGNRAGVVAATVAGVALAGGVGVFFAVSKRPAPPRPSEESAAEPARPAPRPRAEPAPPPLPTMITVEVSGPPPGLTANLDGQPASLPLRMARDGREHKLDFSAPGFVDETKTFEATQDQILTLVLQKAPVTAPAVAHRSHHEDRHRPENKAAATPAPAAQPAAPAPEPAKKRPSAITDI